MKRIFTLTALALMLFAMDSAGQQYSRLTQFMYNPYFVNPAVAGTLNQIPFYLNYRNQWTGFKGAPTTFMASGHFQGPEKSGFGAILKHDDTGGAITRTSIDLTGAYHIDLNNYDAISFGLSFTGSQFKLDNSKLVVYQPDDLELNGMQAETAMNVDANLGMMVYGQNYYFGFSIPQMIQTRLKLEGLNNKIDNQNMRHFHIMGSYRYNINTDFDIQPSGMMKFTPLTPVQMDVNLKVGYRDRVWAGVTARYKDAIAINVAGQMNNYFLGYAFDFTTGSANVLSPFTHELMVGYIIPGKRGKYQSRGAMGPRVLDRGRVVRK
ncbi:MAG: type IX secretion system membrane protein PorP/SprF [Flavobacteriales bacterium]